MPQKSVLSVSTIYIATTCCSVAAQSSNGPEFENTQSTLTQKLVQSDTNLAALVERYPDMTQGWSEPHWYDVLLNGPSYDGSEWRVHDLRRPQPKIASPQHESCLKQVPPDAIVLFDGTSADRFQGEQLDLWSITQGALTASGTAYNLISSNEKFGDVDLYLEFRTPSPANGFGQSRGNSGVFLMERYEIQILDSYENPTFPDGQMGALFGQTPPRVNAARAPGEWQCMSIRFKAPRFEGEALLSPARVTVHLNGLLIQDDVAFKGPTKFAALSEYTKHEAQLPIALQDHGDAGGRVAFRNV